MSAPEDPHSLESPPSRGTENHMLEEQIRSHRMLLELGQIITSEINLEALFDLIIGQTNEFMNTELCSVFMFDEESERQVSTGTGHQDKKENKTDCF